MGREESWGYLQNSVHQAITIRSQHLQLDYMNNVDGDTVAVLATNYSLSVGKAALASSAALSVPLAFGGSRGAG
jgi:hypothetical protein